MKEILINENERILGVLGYETSTEITALGFLVNNRGKDKLVNFS